MPQRTASHGRGNGYKGRISALAMLLAAFIFLHFMAAIRSVLESAESPVRGGAQLARVAFAGALTGMVGMTMALITLAAASPEGANANPVVSRASRKRQLGSPPSLKSPYLPIGLGSLAIWQTHDGEGASRRDRD